MKSLKNTARRTGLGYLIIFITGFFANFYTLENMVVNNDARLTAVNIAGHASQFHMGVGAFALMVLVDLILAFPLYRLLKSTNNKMAMASSVLRFINGAVFALALVNLIEVSLLTANPAQLNDLVMLLLERFNYVWTIGLLFFGLHLLLLGQLVFRSSIFPRLIGVFLQIAGISYLIDSGAQLWLNNYEAYRPIFEIIVISGGVLGEFSFTLFLLMKGIKLTSQKREYTELSL